MSAIPSIFDSVGLSEWPTGGASASAASAAPAVMSRPVHTKVARPSDKELDKLIMNLEVSGVIEKREDQIALLASNGYNWLRAQESYFASHADDDADDGSDGLEVSEERKTGMEDDRPDLSRAGTLVSIAAPPPPPSVMELVVRSDSQLEATYSIKSEKRLEKVMADFVERSKRRLEFVFRGTPVTADMTPAMLGMAAKETLEARAPLRVKRNFSLAGAAAASPAAAMANGGAAAAAAASSSGASQVDDDGSAPLFKRAKSEPIGDSAAAASGASSSGAAAAAAAASYADSVPAAAPFRATWSELLLGSLTFTLVQPRGAIDDAGTLSSPPNNIYITLAPFLRDMKSNCWSEGGAGVAFAPTADTPADEVDAVRAAYEEEYDLRAQNYLIVTTLKMWSRCAGVKCFLKHLSRRVKCACGSVGECACPSRQVVHAFHVSVSLLPAAHNEHIPNGNQILPLLRDEFAAVIDQSMPPIPYPTHERMEAGNLLELAVRTKFSQPTASAAKVKRESVFWMEDEEEGDEPMVAAAAAAAAAAAPSSKRGRRRKGAAAAAISPEEYAMTMPVALNEHERVRVKWGLPTADDEEDLSGPEMDSLRALSPRALSQRCGLKLTLRDYQQQTVLWAMKQEVSESISAPYWDRISISGQPAWYSAYFQAIRFEPLPDIVGGLICEEMGLGKTIEMLALINLNSAATDAPAASSSSALAPARPSVPSGLVPSVATLIIVPTTLVGQWNTEIHTHSSRPLKVAAWYGPNRIRDPHRIAQHDVILTTFKLLLSESRLAANGRPSLLHQIDWHRIIVDESHVLKAKNTQQSRQVLELHSKRRWLLTGTPISTNIEDVFGQFAFFRMPILSTDSRVVSAVRKHVFTKSYGRQQAEDEQRYPASICYALLVRMFTRSIMRHKKNQTFNGRPQLITLPPRTMVQADQENVIKIPFSPPERAQYDRLREFARAQFQEFRRTGTVVSKTIQVLQLLQPQRQACSAGFVNVEDMMARLRVIAENEAARKAAETASAAANLAANQPFNDPDGECAVCLDVMEEALMTLCRHVFCGECIRKVATTTSECPLCRAEVNKKDLVKPPPRPAPPVLEEEKSSDAAAASSSDDHGGAIEFTSKVEALIQQLSLVRMKGECTKSIVFSQFTKTIQTVDSRLRQAGFGVVVINGSMTMPQRKTALHRFISQEDCTVLILSLRAGAVGLTLTAAQHVFMLEPSTNPALTQQAINRVHRVGQTKEVFIHHLVMQDSIEEKVLQATQDKLDTNVGDEEEEVAARPKDHATLRLAELTHMFE